MPEPGPTLEECLNRFDQAWQAGRPPTIEAFVPQAALAVSERRQLLEELVKIDLECRWRWAAQRAGGTAVNGPPGQPGASGVGSLSERPRLEEYVARYPGLGRLEQLPLELIEEEYRARQRWGDRPSHAEYAARFGHHAAKLPELLRRLDTALAAEFARGQGTAPVQAIKPALRNDVSAPRPAPPLVSINVLTETLRRCQLLSPAQLNELMVADWQSRFRDPHGLARELIQRSWLTPYQANQLLLGRDENLVQGPYLLLERLGEGGAGQVFKARHLHMDRLVALKLIRKDLLDDPDVIVRFQREIKVISQLTHPHIVQSYDAGPLGPNFFLAMEYIEATDLSRLVKQSGPLSPAQACEYVRQAALGLQHIHERGLVHRDIKPSNLLVSGGVVEKHHSPPTTHHPPLTTHHSPLTTHQVKILDLGLARLRRPISVAATDEVTTTGSVLMGTLDYMAPEQALDFRQVDIRADIYSLGCTLYFLLTGRAPFADVIGVQKLLYHQQADPPPIEQVRGDLPAWLPSVVRKMMAKRPADRFQTPAEIVRQLAALLPVTVAIPASPPQGLPSLSSTLRTPGSHPAPDDDAPTMATASIGLPVTRGVSEPTSRRGWRRIAGALKRHPGLIATVCAGLVLGIVLVAFGFREQAERRRQVPGLVRAAQLLVNQRHFDEALAQVNVALEYQTDNADARLLKGKVLIVKQDFKGAAAELQLYLLLRPDDPLAKKLIALCDRADPGDPRSIAAFVELFLDNQEFALGIGMGDHQEKILAYFRQRIEKAWPGLGERLKSDPGGKLDLNLRDCGKQVVDLVPLQGIPLARLNLTGCTAIVDLRPLAGMPLAALDLTGCAQVRDLTPLKGMPLTALIVTSGSGQLRDLTPLQGMALTALNVAGNSQVQDLTPLKGMPLTALGLDNCVLVRDLTPLQGMPLTSLRLWNCHGVRDLTPLQGMSLTYIELMNPVPTKGMEVLRAMKGLRKVGSLPADEFWKKYDAGEFKK